ncbi:substrate-binding periplasmic protein [Inhella crocodyli]|uniref:Transporter substrate-binding domain-containing protein n=1 Tax=Inhella crocodyli TaxID=2499851 RepID=A0A3S2U9S5_9BURK|nr:transporter substrate-binding domain-containing protein [Inhella crocodyli]RVT82366.1 transporter substrate-binding domain-containing protein [Inhella crocodyli]
MSEWRGAIVAIGLTVLGWSAHAKALRVCMTDVPHAPWRVAENDGRVAGQGLDFDLLRDFQRISGWTVELQVLSGRRCLIEIAAGRADANVGLSHTPERAQSFRFPMRDGEPDANFSLRQDAYTLYRRRGSTVSWNGQQLKLAAGGAVLVQAGHSVANQLREMGVPVTETERSAFMTLSKVKLGEADAAAVFTSEGQALLQAHPQFAELEAMSPVLARKHYFVAFGEPFARQNEAELAGLWRAFQQAAKAPTYQSAVRRAKNVR